MAPTKLSFVCNPSICVFCQRLISVKIHPLKSIGTNGSGSKSGAILAIRRSRINHGHITKASWSRMLTQPIIKLIAGHRPATLSFHTSLAVPTIPSAAGKQLSNEPVRATDVTDVLPSVSSWTERWPSYLFSISTFQLFSKWKARKNSASSSSNLVAGAAVASVPDTTLPKPATVIKTAFSKASLENRTRFLVQAIATAHSNMAHHLKVEELCRFLRQHPDAPSLAAKAGAVQQLLMVKQATKDPVVLEELEECLVLLGCCKPPSGWGVRILSIDGGGLRGVMALEILRQLEDLTGKPVHQMFDYVCGVSTGAILTVLLGALKSSIGRCEALYRDIGSEIFQRNPIWGTSKLVLSHAFYDTDNWTKLLRTHVGEQILVETARNCDCPKIAAISTVVNRQRLEPFLFRNYGYPYRVRSLYPGTHEAHLWEAIRASAAAPGYFEEFKLGENIHQDGGILVNNPTAVALHECKHLWPNETLQCVVSIGSGRYEPLLPAHSTAYTGLKNKLLKIVDSATDTEGVHTILHDLLPPTTYFRFNPYLSENISLDETREEKIQQLQNDARMYLRRNEPKLRMAAALLTQPRTHLQQVKDFVSLKATTFFN